MSNRIVLDIYLRDHFLVNYRPTLLPLPINSVLFYTYNYRSCQRTENFYVYKGMVYRENIISATSGVNNIIVTNSLSVAEYAGYNSVK